MTVGIDVDAIVLLPGPFVVDGVLINSLRKWGIATQDQQNNKGNRADRRPELETVM